MCVLTFLLPSEGDNVYRTECLSQRTRGGGTTACEWEQGHSPNCTRVSGGAIGAELLINSFYILTWFTITPAMYMCTRTWCSSCAFALRLVICGVSGSACVAAVQVAVLQRYVLGSVCTTVQVVTMETSFTSCVLHDHSIDRFH